MVKGSRRSKKNKRPRSPTIVPPSTKIVESAPLPPSVTKLQRNRIMLTSKETFIAAHVQSCFDTLAMQLERSADWDPIIVDARPVSNVRRRIGATSRVTLNLCGEKLESQAMISRYRPNRAISWILSNKPKLSEDWWLEPKSHGTVVGVTFAWEVPGWIIGRFVYKVIRRKRVEQDLDKMLAQLKKAVESISRERRLTGMWK